MSTCRHQLEPLQSRSRHSPSQGQMLQHPHASQGHRHLRGSESINLACQVRQVTTLTISDWVASCVFDLKMNWFTFHVILLHVSFDLRFLRCDSNQRFHRSKVFTSQTSSLLEVFSWAPRAKPYRFNQSIQSWSSTGCVRSFLRSEFHGSLSVALALLAQVPCLGESSCWMLACIQQRNHL